MSALAQSPAGSAVPVEPSLIETMPEDAALEALLATIRRNRFLPAPQPGSVFVGDGDYRLIGAEFLGHLVRLGGLRPEARVLDIGCGIGRIAVPLTQYLGDEGSYLGLDPVREGIDWCRAEIAPVYPAFRFRHLDIAHEIYNPQGLLTGETLVLPVGDRSVDFAFMVSVATHLRPAEIARYAREAARVLAPGGTLFVTHFEMDEAARRSSVRDPRRGFVRTSEGPDWHADPSAPLGAVAFDAGWLRACLRWAGLDCVTESPGHWRGGEAAHYQDILVARKPDTR
ncbi:class I SAM-dependent methyltransferase [Aureimonas sp. AU20]|uniref:class I SAM-dependent methyltransferase n=1 Tax=Aureimonas sp. AU20 TaxID=1349819 RepID=UPI00072158A0|nr:class I SAM-dependent methyltransferase [Aureimonas sp. AU20]ALN72199.1 hypothetical protein M673_05695 [Aureimonas sp. AU20]